MLLTQKRHVCLFAAAWIGGTVLYCRRENVWPVVLALLGLFLLAGIVGGNRPAHKTAAGAPPGERRAAAGVPPGERRAAAGVSPGERRAAPGAPPGERRAAAGAPPGERRAAAGAPPGEWRAAAGVPPGEQRTADGASFRERLIVACIVAALILIAFSLCAGRDRRAASVRQMLDAHPGTEISGTVLSKEIQSERCVYTLRTPYKKVIAYCETDEIPIGSDVTVRGDWKAFSPATNEGSFDSADYYQNKNISFRIYADEIRVVRASRGNFREGLYRLQQRISRVFSDSLSAEEAGVLSALTVGNKGLMDPEVKAMYQEAGISHILAISGLHISILGLGIYRFLRRLCVPCHLCEALGCGVVLVFVIMSGGSVSAIRALVMYLLLMGSHTTGRTYDPVNALALAALALLIPNPMNLYQSGFQFSFLAMAAITLYRAVSRRAGEARKEREQIRRESGPSGGFAEPFGSDTGGHAASGARTAPASPGRSVSDSHGSPVEPPAPGPLARFAASLRERLLFGAFLQLALLPLTAWYYFEVPLYATFLNLLILPLCSALLGFGLAGGLLGILLPQAARWLLVPCHVILRIYEGAIHVIDHLPLNNWITGQPSAWLLLAFYAALVGACALYLWRVQRMQFVLEAQRAWRTQAVQTAPAYRAASARSGPPARDGASARPCPSAHDGASARQSPPAHSAASVRQSPPARGASSVWPCPSARCVGCAWLLALALLACILFVPERQVCRIDFLDVGQGDGIFIADGAGTRMMIDGGSSSESSVGEYEIAPFLKVHGIRKVDAWILTHGDADHYSGLLELLEDGFCVEYLVLAEAMPRDETWAALVSVAEANGTEVVYVAAGDAIAVAGGTMTCLYPAAEDGTGEAGGTATDGTAGDGSVVTAADGSGATAADGSGATAADGGKDTATAAAGGAEDANEFSQVWLFSRDGLSALFTGDISAEQEQTLLARGLLSDLTVLKVAHHGSKYSSCEAFLAATSPHYAVISCSANNIYGHPAPETLERLDEVGSEIYGTPQCGQITFYERRGVWKMRTFLP